MKVKECSTAAEMLGNYPLFQQLHNEFTPETYARYIADVVKENYHQAVLQDDKGNTIALIAYQRQVHAQGPLLYIRDFVTDEKFRGKRAANKLLHWAEQIKSRELGCVGIYLDTVSPQTNTNLSKLEQHYAKNGYEAGGKWMHKMLAEVSAEGVRSRL